MGFVKSVVLAAAMSLGMSCATAQDSDFVGSKQCGKCHEDEFASWQNSYHAKMVRPKDEAILKDVVEQWGNGVPGKANVSGAPATLDDVATTGQNGIRNMS